MVGGTIFHREVIPREISRALVLNLSGEHGGAHVPPRRSLSLTQPSLLSRATRRSSGPDGSNDCLPLVLGDGAFVGRVLWVFHCEFEAANTVSDSFAEFRKLFSPEYEQSNPKKSLADAWVEKVLRAFCVSFVFKILVDHGIE